MVTTGSATKDEDFVLSSDTIFILPGATTGSITVTAKWSEDDPQGDN